jgi:hypothetical protein
VRELKRNLTFIVIILRIITLMYRIVTREMGRWSYDTRTEGEIDAIAKRKNNISINKALGFCRNGSHGGRANPFDQLLIITYLGISTITRNRRGKGYGS